jgi:hypothetical protein
MTSIDDGIVKSAAQNPAIHDFEDGIQYYSAYAQSCKVLITQNEEDFYFGEIEVLNCQEFIARYI